MDNESIKRCDECTCWKDNNMIAHKCTERRKTKHFFLSEPRKVNKPIHKSEPSQVNKQTLRVNLSDNDSIMMFEWAKSKQDENSDYKLTSYIDYCKKTKWTLQINKSMAWSGPKI